MIAVKKPCRRIRSDEQGAAATEFGLLLLPFAIVLMGAFDLGYQMYIRSVLEGTLADAARDASVQNPVFAYSGTTLEEKIQKSLEERVNSIARNATYDVSITNFYEFSGVGKPEKLTYDANGNGQFDEADHDCWKDLNNNGTYDMVGGRAGVGGASDVVFYQVTLTMPRLFPMANLLGASNNYEIEASTLFKSQPYTVQNAPNIECGDP